MTISTTANQVIAAGDGVNTAFNFSFQVRGASDLVVTYTDASGISTTLPSSAYSVALNAIAAGQLWAAGGAVTYPLSGSPIASGTRLTITRQLAPLQSTSLINQGGYYPQSVESALDVLTMMVQQGLNAQSTAGGSGAFYNLSVTGLATFTGGGVFRGQIGSGGLGRTDAQVELQNLVAGQKPLLSYYQGDPLTETGIASVQSLLSTGATQQQVGVFAGFVNADNTYATWKAYYGIHVVGAAGDNTEFLAFSNNAMKLIYGATSDAPWNTAPVDNSIQIGHGTTTLAGLQIKLGLVSGWVGLGAQNLTLSASNYNVLIKNDGNMNLNAPTGATVALTNNGSTVAVVSATGMALTGLLDINGAAASGTAGHLYLGSGVQTTIGANGGASVLTANPLGYLTAYLGSTKIIIPYYNG